MDTSYVKMPATSEMPATAGVPATTGLESIPGFLKRLQISGSVYIYKGWKCADRQTTANSWNICSNYKDSFAHLNIEKQKSYAINIQR